MANRDDEIEEISPDALDGDPGGTEPRAVKVVPGQKVTLGAPPPMAAEPEKTRVGAMDDGMPPVPADAEKTMITPDPSLPAGGDEATMIMSSHAGGRARATSRGKLTVVVGKEEGQSFELTDGTRVVGRSREVDICLLDIQVSRRHVEIVADGSGVLVRDLGSGNGTLVNGEPVTEARLVDGDEVSIGDHVLRFEAAAPAARALARLGDPGSVPADRTAVGGPGPVVPSVAAVRRARRSGGGADPKKKRLVLVAGVVGAVLVVAVLAKLAMRPAKIKPPPPNPSVVAVKDFEAGLALFKKARYPDALAKFQSAARADPNLGKATEYVKATKREIAAAASIKKGDALLVAGKYDEARAAFRAVGSESLRYADAQAGLERVAAAQGGKAVGQGQQGLDATRQQLDALVAKVKSIPGGPGSNGEKGKAFEDAITALDALAGRLDGPAQAFAHALSVSPNDANAKAGEAAVNQLKDDLTGKETWAKRQYAEWQAQVHERGVESHDAYVKRMLAPGLHQFDQGQFREAASSFARLAATNPDPEVKGKASRKAAAIKRFLPGYTRGMAAPVNQPSPGALAALSTADAEAKVVDPHSPVLAKVEKQLGNRYYLKGRVDYNAQRYARAYHAWSRALRFDPGQHLAREGLGDLEARAKKLYLQAYIQKTLNRSQAIAEWKQVLAMTPATDPYHRKAEQRLQEMGAE